MTLLYIPFWRDDMFHVEQFALYAHFLQKTGEKRLPFYLAATAEGWPLVVNGAPSTVRSPEPVVKV